MSVKQGSYEYDCDFYLRFRPVTKGTLNFARRHSFRVTDQSFGPRTTKFGMQGSFWVIPTWLEGFLANITMKPKNPMDFSEGVVELVME